MEIVQIVEELQSLSSNGTRVPGFRRKVLVDIDRLMGLAEKLHSSVPASVMEAQEILNQRESIINQARLEAQRVKGAASEEASATTTKADREHASRVDESEIVKGAEAKAQEIRDEAMAEGQQIVQDAQKKVYRMMNEAEALANSRRDSADQYSREVLFNLEERLAGLLGQVRKGIDILSLESEAQEADNHVPVA